MLRITAKHFFYTFVPKQKTYIMNFKKTNVVIKSDLKTSKPIEISKGINTPPDKRKSLKTANSGLKREVIPPSTLTSVLPFISLVCLFSKIKEYNSVNGYSCNFNGDLFVVLLYVCCSGVTGVSVGDLSRLLYNSDSAKGYRMLVYRLDSLLRCGLVTFVSIKGVRRAYISIHAETLIHKSVSKSDLRKMQSMLKGI